MIAETADGGRRIARPTNHAGGLEGGVTNGEDLRVTGYMKPISTLMKPLRSVDLTSLEEAPAAIERSDVCAVPAAAVVGEAMVALVLADALTERFGGDSLASAEGQVDGRRRTHPGTGPPAGRRRRPVARMIRPILRLGDPLLQAPAQPVADLTPEIERLIDDMVETMYAAPGIGLAAPQVGVSLRIFVIDLSVGRDRNGLIVMINPEFIEREGMQLEEEGCLSLPGFTATVAAPRARRRPRTESPGRGAHGRGHGPARPRAAARDGSPRRARCSSIACAASSGI